MAKEKITIANTWQNALPALCVILEDATEEGKRQAREELQRMARLADMANEAGNLLMKLSNVINVDDDGDYFICNEAGNVFDDMAKLMEKYKKESQ